MDVAAAAPRTGDVPIGAVVVDADGRELAAACNAREALGDPTAHAEILALRAAAARARGSGGWRAARWPSPWSRAPCARARSVLARVARVVFGAWEPRTGAAGSLWDVLRDRRLNHRPEVVGGVLEEECAALLVDFWPGRRREDSVPYLVGGSVSERPKERASKARVGSAHRGFESHRYRP